MTEGYIEKTRTMTGDELFRAGISLDEIDRRVEVEIAERDGNEGRVETSLDGGAFASEGWYVLSGIEDKPNPVKHDKDGFDPIKPEDWE